MYDMHDWRQAAVLHYAYSALGRRGNLDYAGPFRTPVLTWFASYVLSGCCDWWGRCSH